MSLALRDSLRRALATAQRSFKERDALVEKVGRESEKFGRANLTEFWRSRARNYRREATAIKDAIHRIDMLSMPTDVLIKAKHKIA